MKAGAVKILKAQKSSPHNYIFQHVITLYEEQTEMSNFPSDATFKIAKNVARLRFQEGFEKEDKQIRNSTFHTFRVKQRDLKGSEMYMKPKGSLSSCLDSLIVPCKPSCIIPSLSFCPPAKASPTLTLL